MAAGKQTSGCSMKKEMRVDKESLGDRSKSRDSCRTKSKKGMKRIQERQGEGSTDWERKRQKQRRQSSENKEFRVTLLMV